MVDALQGNVFDRVLEKIHEDHHYKFKPFQAEGVNLKEKKDQQNWTVLHHYLHLSENVDLAVVNTLVKDQGVDVMAKGNQNHTTAVCAAKNVKCKMETLKALQDMGVDLKEKCETDATVLMYYVRYTDNLNHECVKYLMDQGNDIKHADKNKMTCLHYTMINNHAGADEMRHLVEKGADVNAKMAQDIDMLDLVIYTQNMKNANFHRILRLTRYLVEKMDISAYDLRKLVVIQQLMTFDKLLMCKLRHHGDQLQGKKQVFELPELVFRHVTDFI